MKKGKEKKKRGRKETDHTCKIQLFTGTRTEVLKFYKDFASSVEQRTKENLSYLFFQVHMLEENQSWQKDKIPALVKAQKT